MNIEQRHLKLELDRIFRFIYKLNHNSERVLDPAKIPKAINDLEMLRRKIKGSYVNLALISKWPITKHLLMNDIEFVQGIIMTWSNGLTQSS